MKNNYDRTVVICQNVGTTSDDGYVGDLVMVDTFNVHETIGGRFDNAAVAARYTTVGATVNQSTVVC